MPRNILDATVGLGRRQLLALAAGATLLAKTARGEAKAATSATPSARSAEYTLPALPYAANALDSFLSEEILTLHHDKHHAGYVKGLNKALADLDEARQAGRFEAIKELERAVAFHGSGHVLHSLYWVSISPAGGGAPKGDLAKLIDAGFGSLDGFRKHFAAATKAAEASAWGLLSYEPLGQRLVITAAESHENMAFQGSIPLLACDVWEHAYYLKYKSDRAGYVDKFFDVIDWAGVESRLKAVRV